ncbi:MAG: hypothetical protein ACYDGY_00975 [Acidimicrobiales bacterium]
MNQTRYRCTGCGNLTRFDVVAEVRSKSFYHYTVGGELHIEDEVVLSKEIADIVCRWCGPGISVEEVEVPYAEIAGSDEGAAAP